MKLIYKADVVKAVPARWAEQYRTHSYPHTSAITERLNALPKGFTAEEVDAIIGNSGWTGNRCDECGTDQAVLVRFGDEPDYEARWQDLCLNCLNASVALAKQGE